MPVTQDDLTFAAMQQRMSDEEFLQAWHAAVAANDDEWIAVFESAATHRFGLATWHHRYAVRFPRQNSLSASNEEAAAPLSAIAVGRAPVSPKVPADEV